MSRPSSPHHDEPSLKRQRTSIEPNGSPSQTEMAQPELPAIVTEIVEDGDTILVLNGLGDTKEPVGVRVTSFALSMASPTFKAFFAVTALRAKQSALQVSDGTTSTADKGDNDSSTTAPITIVPVPTDDPDSMFILCNLLHLRNDNLPKTMFPERLYNLAYLAHKYQCVVAAGRAAAEWFDRLHTSRNPGDLWKIIEAAFLFDDPLFFARFTSRWTLEQPMASKRIPMPSCVETQKLALMLSTRHTAAEILLRTDLDRLVDKCAYSFSSEGKHFIDYPPGSNTDEDPNTGRKPPECRVDGDGGFAYLGALRDAQIWPSTEWVGAETTGGRIKDVVDALVHFREPEYDDCDKCVCCNEIKVEFTDAVERLRQVHKERLWGLCLDCYKAGGINDDEEEECRFEHAKA